MKHFLLHLFCVAILIFFYSDKTIAASTTLYLGPPEKTLETNESVTYVPAGLAIVRKTASEITYLSSNHLNSTVLATDKSGNKLNSFSYYPYGNNLTIQQFNTDKLYTSQRKDFSTNLYFYQARYYNPQTGRFLSADKAEGPNRFAYVTNNPLLKNDPSGLAAAITDDQINQFIKKYREIYTTGKTRELLDLLDAGTITRDMFMIAILRTTTLYTEANVAAGLLDREATELIDDMMTRDVLEYSNKSRECLSQLECFTEVIVRNDDSIRFAPYLGINSDNLINILNMYWPYNPTVLPSGKKEIRIEAYNQNLEIALQNINYKNVKLYHPTINPRYEFDPRDVQSFKNQINRFVKNIPPGVSLFQKQYAPGWGIVGYQLPVGTFYPDISGNAFNKSNYHISAGKRKFMEDAAGFDYYK